MARKEQPRPPAAQSKVRCLHVRYTDESAAFDVELPASLPEEKPLLEILVENSVEISHSCGGMGSCGTCRVFITSRVGELPQRTEVENEIANDRGFTSHERLSCQVTFADALAGDAPLDWAIAVPPTEP